MESPSEGISSRHDTLDLRWTYVCKQGQTPEISIKMTHFEYKVYKEYK